MRGFLLFSLLAAITDAQAPTATARLSHFVRGGADMPWHELGDVLVKATLDEDAAAVAQELLDNLDAARPAENQQRALTALLRWSELPTFRQVAAADSTRLGKALLPVIERPDAPVALRGKALVALGRLPREGTAYLGKAEAALRRRLNPKAKVDNADAAMAPFQLQYLAAAAPASLWTLPVIAEIARTAEPGSDTWKAGLQALSAVGRSGAATDARTAFVACGALLPACTKEQFAAVVKAMADLLRGRQDLLAAEAPLLAAVAVIERAQATGSDAEAQTATRIGPLGYLGVGQQVRAIGLGAFTALARLEPETARAQATARIDKLMRDVGDTDPDLQALQRAWAEQKH